jgi:hypothetical protein
VVASLCYGRDGDKESGRGTGKTALLRHFQHRINHDWGQTEFSKFSAAVIYVAFPDQVDRLYSEQMAWAALLDAHDSGLIKGAAAALRLNEIERRWPQLHSAVMAKVSEFENASKDPVDVLFDQNELAACGLKPEDVLEAAVERLVDVEVEGSIAEAFASNALDSHLKKFRRDGLLRPYWAPRDTKGLIASRQIFLDEMVKFLDEAGFAGTYLFVDDVENLTDQMANKEAIEFAKELGQAFLRPGRAASDRRYFTTVLTAHQQSATKLARGWSEAGLQAVARLDPGADTSIRVPLPSEDGALEMLAAYITHFRSEGPSVDRLHPFSDAAARKLVQGVQPALHPRTFLQKAHYVIKTAANDELDAVDVPVVDKILKETGMHSAPSEAQSDAKIEDY